MLKHVLEVGAALASVVGIGFAVKRKMTGPSVSPPPAVPTPSPLPAPTPSGGGGTSPTAPVGQALPDGGYASSDSGNSTDINYQPTAGGAADATSALLAPTDDTSDSGDEDDADDTSSLLGDAAALLG